MTLDSHHKKHIAHASFWSNLQNDKEGKGISPQPFTQILSSELSGKDDTPIKWYPRDCALEKYVVEYTKKLEDKGKFTLTIWPDHCLVRLSKECLLLITFYVRLELRVTPFKTIFRMPFTSGVTNTPPRP